MFLQSLMTLIKFEKMLSPGQHKLPNLTSQIVTAFFALSHTLGAPFNHQTPLTPLFRLSRCTTCFVLLLFSPFQHSLFGPFDPFAYSILDPKSTYRRLTVEVYFRSLLEYLPANPSW